MKKAKGIFGNKPRIKCNIWEAWITSVLVQYVLGRINSEKSWNSFGLKPKIISSKHQVWFRWYPFFLNGSKPFLCNNYFLSWQYVDRPHLFSPEPELSVLSRPITSGDIWSEPLPIVYYTVPMFEISAAPFCKYDAVSCVLRDFIEACHFWKIPRLGK